MNELDRTYNRPEVGGGNSKAAIIADAERAYGDLDGYVGTALGSFEGIAADDHRLAGAIRAFYLNGGSDQDGGDVETGLAYSRAGRFVLWTDDQGFFELETFETVDAASAECDAEDARQSIEATED